MNLASGGGSGYGAGRGWRHDGPPGRGTDPTSRLAKFYTTDLRAANPTGAACFQTVKWCAEVVEVAGYLHQQIKHGSRGSGTSRDGAAAGVCNPEAACISAPSTATMPEFRRRGQRHLRRAVLRTRGRGAAVAPTGGAPMVLATGTFTMPDLNDLKAAGRKQRRRRTSAAAQVEQRPGSLGRTVSRSTTRGPNLLGDPRAYGSS